MYAIKITLLALVIALLYILPANAQADADGFLSPYTSGVAVVIDLDRNGKTTHTVGNDARVPNAEVNFTMKDGTFILMTTNEFGAVFQDMTLVEKITVTCPPLVGHTEMWPCAEDQPIIAGVQWNAVLVQPVAVFLPVIGR